MEKKVKTKIEHHYYPQPIVHDIVSRLPTKSLVRFNSVCKLWHTMISDSTFEETNLQQQMSKIGIIAQQSGGHKFLHCLEETEDGVRARELASLPLRFCKSDMRYCNTLILFKHSSTVLGLYDTITQRRKLLPSINYYKLGSLVYDASNQIYKVVVFRRDFYINRNKLSLISCLYSLDYERWSEDEDGEWRLLKPPGFQTNLLSCIAVKGILYWVSLMDDDYYYDVGRFMIQPLEIASEKFLGIILLPCRPRRTPYYGLLEMKGSLCLVNPGSDTDTELDIWVLKDSVQSNWIKQYTISLLTMVDRPTSLESFYWDTFTPCLVLESCSNKSAYILFNSLSELYWYTVDNQKVRKIDFKCSPVILAVSVLD